MPSRSPDASQPPRGPNFTAQTAFRWLRMTDGYDRPRGHIIRPTVLSAVASHPPSGWNECHQSTLMFPLLRDSGSASAGAERDHRRVRWSIAFLAKRRPDGSHPQSRKNASGNVGPPSNARSNRGSPSVNEYSQKRSVPLFSVRMARWGW